MPRVYQGLQGAGSGSRESPCGDSSAPLLSVCFQLAPLHGGSRARATGSVPLELAVGGGSREAFSTVEKVSRRAPRRDPSGRVRAGAGQPERPDSSSGGEEAAPPRRGVARPAPRELGV